MVSAPVIALKFAVLVSCGIDVLTCMLVGVLVGSLAGVLPGVMICVVTGIAADALPEASINLLTNVVTGDIVMLTSFEKVSTFC